MEVTRRGFLKALIAAPLAAAAAPVVARAVHVTFATHVTDWRYAIRIANLDRIALYGGRGGGKAAMLRALTARAQPGHLTGDNPCVPATLARPTTPGLVFDGEVFWFTKGFDEDDDRCCGGTCREKIDPESVPLMIFREVPIAGQRKPATWVARFCERCSRAVYIRSRRV
jgi:hypothetical protein